MTTLKKIQTGMSWVAHVKKESLDGASHNQLILAAPVIINDTCQLPGFVVNLSPIITTLKHLKKCNYVDKPVGPNVSIALGGSIFLMRHLFAYGHRPGGSPLSASPHTVLSRILSSVPVSTMNKTSSMMLTLFEKVVLI